MHIPIVPPMLAKIKNKTKKIGIDISPEKKLLWVDYIGLVKDLLFKGVKTL